MTIGAMLARSRAFATRRFAIALLPLALSGCVLLPPLDLNQAFRLSVAEPVAPIVQVIDDRSPEERAAHARSDGWQVGETSVTPDVASYVAQELTRVLRASADRARLEGLLAGRTVHLRHFDAGATKSRGPVPDLRQVPGSTVDQRLVVHSLDLAGAGLNAITTVHVVVEIDIDGVPHTGEGAGGRHVEPFENLLVEPAHDAIVQIVAQVGRVDEAAPTPP